MSETIVRSVGHNGFSGRGFFHVVLRNGCNNWRLCGAEKEY